MLSITAEIREMMVQHAIDGLPNEACGLFAGEVSGDDLAVTEFYPMKNAAESVELYYFDPKEHMEVEKRADEAGRSIAGVMHSHTYTAAYPSPTDVEDATNFDPFGSWHYIIVTLQHETPELRSYRIIDSEIREEEVKVV